jgi:hypothetical protein
MMRHTNKGQKQKRIKQKSIVYEKKKKKERNHCHKIPFIRQFHLYNRNKIVFYNCKKFQ